VPTVALIEDASERTLEARISATGRVTRLACEQRKLPRPLFTRSGTKCAWMARRITGECSTGA